MPAPSIRTLRPVAWADTDASGRHHFTAVFRWVEDAENELLERLGLAGELAGRMPRAHVEAAYQAALHFRQEVEVELTAAGVGTTSVTYEFVVRAGEAAAASGRYVTVLVDDTGRSVPLPVDAAATLGGGTS